MTEDGDYACPPQPIPVMVTSGVGRAQLGVVIGWRGRRVLAQWTEDGGSVEQWLPASAVKRTHHKPAAAAKPKATPSAEPGRRAPNRSFLAKHESPCARCSVPIKVGQSARFAPDGAMVHHRHESVAEVLPPPCPRCFLVGPCDC